MPGTDYRIVQDELINTLVAGRDTVGPVFFSFLVSSNAQFPKDSWDSDFCCVQALSAPGDHQTAS